MGCCCGKEQVVVGVQERELPRELPAVKYHGPPPEHYATERNRIGRANEDERLAIKEEEETQREILFQKIRKILAAQEQKEVADALAKKQKEIDDALAKERAEAEKRRAEFARQQGAERSLHEAAEDQGRFNIEASYAHGFEDLLHALKRALRDQTLEDMLKLDVCDLEHALAHDDDALGEMDSANGVGLEDMFGKPRILGEDEISVRSANSRHSTLSTLDWDAALKGRQEYSPPASHRSFGQPSPLRSKLLDRHPLLKLEIDEVGARDEITRDGLGGVIAMRIEAFQHNALLTRRRYVIPHLLESYFIFIMAVCEQMEAYCRLDVEHQWLHGLGTLYQEIFRKEAKKIQWSSEMRKMDERKARKTAAQRTLRDEEKKADKLRWEVERVRLEGMKTSSAPERLRAELDEARMTGGTFTGASPGRLLREQARQRASLSTEEERFRQATALEEQARWQALWDGCAEECPWIVNHPHREGFIAKKNAEVAKWQLLANGIIAREDIAKIFSGEADGRSLSAARRNQKHCKANVLSADALFKGHVAALAHTETTKRDSLIFDEAVGWSRLLDALSLDAELSAIHAKRRRVREWDAGREERLLGAQTKSRLLLQRVGRGFQWRQRLSKVVPVQFEIRDLIGHHQRGHKALIQKENIERGDIFHYLVQEARLSATQFASAQLGYALPTAASHTEDVAPGMVEDLDNCDEQQRVMNEKRDAFGCLVDTYLRQAFPSRDVRDYPWDPSVLGPVEEIARERLWRDFIKSYDEAIHFPAALEKEKIRGMPQEMIGVRFRSVVRIQRAYRSYRLRHDFNTKYRDAMVFAKLQRVKNKTAQRLVKEQEREARYVIEDEYFAFGYHKMSSTIENWFSRWRAESLAAAKIQALFRGVAVRSQRDPRLLAFLKKKLYFLREKRMRRPQVM